MKRKFFILVAALISILLVGCADQMNISGDPTNFETSNVSAKCANCHNDLIDPSGADMSYVTLWSGSMHANASIDPYFLASIRHEVDKFPALKEPIESTCSKCHLPLARWISQDTGQPTTFLDTGPANPANPLHGLYRESVACIVCHRISPNGLGTPASFSGGYQLGLKSSSGSPYLYGPFDLSFEGRAMMENATHSTVQKSDHMAGSEFCAACHTLYTSPVARDGSPSSEKFPEQVPYLEWKQSAFNGKATCQSCHLPPSTAAARISNRVDTARSPVHPHTFTGSNVFMLNLLKSDAGEAGSLASAATLDSAIGRTTTLLQKQTASLKVAANIERKQLNLSVTVANLTGHKLPTAYPSRRAWLHVTVVDPTGKIQFESGAWQANGAITGNDNDQDPTRSEPHFNVIQSADQVQIYEAILNDLEKQVTTSIIEASGYLKDNRILPDGFDKRNADPDTAVTGAALDDENFKGGQDEVLYQVPLEGVVTSITVRVELVYQSIGYRWLQNLNAGKSAELDRLQKLTAAVPNIPIVLASQEIQVTGLR